MQQILLIFCRVAEKLTRSALDWVQRLAVAFFDVEETTVCKTTPSTFLIRPVCAQITALTNQSLRARFDQLFLSLVTS